MRIIAGIHKNRRLDFKNLNIRPTTNFAKESLFNILNNYFDFEKISALDLFAGSGNISYEFISRGCKKIVAVEKNKKCINFINKIKCKLTLDNLTIYCSDVISYLKKETQSYDVIFLDPPFNYTQNQYDEIIRIIINNKLLNENTMIIIEHGKFINFDSHPLYLKTKKYGRVHFSFLKNEK
ncbi:MAG: 16S rRNA (guanine(966)-N(2))-methyltransferase RsmD [Flavobacteriales bacterium]|nr:16S rRNA (guanine(966)-N(2))-methyltransferase RsmD [Flavobacteriales bacterium]|tara:strand:- start:3732 stop:4274 length:543 start_codon:yes stop_codon:yes gene_type:complete